LSIFLRNPDNKQTKLKHNRFAEIKKNYGRFVLKDSDACVKDFGGVSYFFLKS